MTTSTDDLKALIRQDVSRDVFIDLFEQFTKESQAAHDCVRNHTGLTGSRESRATGFVRFLMNERAFEAVTLKHGAIDLEGGCLPVLNLRIYQPYCRFGRIVLGFASHAEPGEMPPKNQSRHNAAQLNLDLTPHLELEPAAPSEHVFVLMLLSRDPTSPGKIREAAIAVVDSTYSYFVLYESLDHFLEGYDAAGTPSSEPPPQPLVKLREKPRHFEAPEDQRDESGNEVARKR